MFIIERTEHTKGDHKCGECVYRYPKNCACGGYIHAQFLREDWQGMVELKIACDQCGDKYKFLNYSPRKKTKRIRRRKTK